MKSEMIKKIILLVVAALVFYAFGSLTVVIHFYQLFLFFAPPFHFSLACFIVLLIAGKRKEFQSTDILISLVGYNAGLLVSMLFSKLFDESSHNVLFTFLTHSIIGGSIVLLYSWRSVKGLLKYFLLPLIALFSGLIFDLYWEYQLTGFSYFLGKFQSNHNDSFAAWFTVVGTTVIAAKLFFQKYSSAEELRTEPSSSIPESAAAEDSL